MMVQPAAPRPVPSLAIDINRLMQLRLHSQGRGARTGAWRHADLVRTILSGLATLVQAPRWRIDFRPRWPIELEVSLMYPRQTFSNPRITVTCRSKGIVQT